MRTRKGMWLWVVLMFGGLGLVAEVAEAQSGGMEGLVRALEAQCQADQNPDVCALAQQQRAKLSQGGDMQDQVVAACSKNKGHALCVALRKECKKTLYPADPICERLGYTREDQARSQIKELKERCDVEDHDEGCVALRTSCREEGPTCEQIKELACEGKEYCDEEFLCTPSRLKSVCSGKTDLGATHMLMGASYALPESGFGDHILAGYALGHGQTGKPGIGGTYVVDMNLGWYSAPDDNGMSYELQALIGAGSRTGKFILGVAGGGGFSGIAGGPLGFGWLLSVEAFAQANVPGGIEVLAYVRPSYVFSEDPRGDGSDVAPFADEFTAGATLSWVSKHKEGNFIAGTGYGLHFFYKEQLGFNMFGIAIGSATSDVSQ